MSLVAILLITTSAFMHAFWNFYSKRRRPFLAFFCVTAVSAALLLAPLLIYYRHILPLVPFSVWALVLAAGAAQLVYFFGLAGAYQRGDISLAYPLARALPVLFVAAVSLVLGRGEEIAGLGLIGMLLITAGCIVLPLPDFQRLRWAHYRNAVNLMAIVAAVGTTGYTLLDDQALKQLRVVFSAQLSSNAITLLYIGLQATSTALMLALGTALLPRERKQLREILHDRFLLRAGILTGVVIMATYGLVLASMAYVTNVSYVAAFRQLSIPIGAVLGLSLQGEPRYRPKILGIIIVTIGLVLVGLG